VIARHPQRFEVEALVAGSNVAALLELCARFQPRLAAIADEAGLPQLRAGLAGLGLATQARAGSADIDAIAADPASDTVVAAIVGAAGVSSTLAAARAGKRLLLANKESIVLAGQVLVRAAAEGGATLLPVDSEHNAIFQCLPAGADRGGVRRLLLTASGGPFRGRTRDQLHDVTPEQACAHPNWVMGRKISVDSATLMNKGLEVIEAHHLFGFEADAIEVVVHPQSVIHSLVDYVDGSVLGATGQSRHAHRAGPRPGLAGTDRVRRRRARPAGPGALRLRAAGPGGLPLPGPGLRRAARRRQRPGHGQCRQRGRGRRLPGRPPVLPGHSGADRGTLSALPAEPADSLDVLLACDARARRKAEEICRTMALA
jgi:1-deoxy-D-xylulose-5-phosphate reductoisomerase